jgi:plasmid replication initiation protein
MKQAGVTIAQANVLTQAKYNYSVVEKRAIYFIIREVRKQFIENPNGQKDLFDDLVLQMSTESLQKSDTDLRDVYAAMKSLRKKDIWIEDDNKVLNVGYINYFEHTKNELFLEVQVSKKILPYLVELAGQFTSYSLVVAISLKTKYAQRFYEYCAQWRTSGFFMMSIKDIREKLGIGNTYPRWSQLQDRVIEVARKELFEAYEKNACDLYFEYSEVKAGRTVTHLKFYVHPNSSETAATEGAPKLEDMVYFIRTLLSEWLKADKRPKNKAWINKVITHVNLNSNLIPKLYKRLTKMKLESPNENHAALARHLIEEDFMEA